MTEDLFQYYLLSSGVLLPKQDNSTASPGAIFPDLEFFLLPVHTEFPAMYHPSLRFFPFQTSVLPAHCLILTNQPDSHISMVYCRKEHFYDIPGFDFQAGCIDTGMAANVLIFQDIFIDQKLHR